MDPEQPAQRRWDDTTVARLAVVEAIVQELRAALKELHTSLSEIAEQMRRRPSWAVVSLLTMQTTAIGILSTWLALRR
jgi:uncharacterized membrane protein YjjP (DUF1212 family)